MTGPIKPDLSTEQREELERYLSMHWRRAEDARSQETESFYKTWDRQYRAVPAQKQRNFPWPNASNFVVPIIRMYVDTFVARTLNVVFKTRPLVGVSGYPSEMREALEAYLNLKCRQDWNVYELARGILMRGNKYGTAVTKVFWREREVNSPVQVFSEDGSNKLESIPVMKYSGPWADHIAFDDWFLYPITANSVDEVEIMFHRLRYPEEVAHAKREEWGLTGEEIEAALRYPSGAKRDQEQRAAGVDDGQYRELSIVECHFNWEVGGKTFRSIALYEPETKTLVDFQINSYPPQIELFHAYRPFPRDDVFPGESMCEILSQGQEEVSQIHNERRNLSVMTSAPIILKKEGARIPGQGNNVFYPGKVYTVEDMDDFSVQTIGGNYQDMIAEENHSLSLADRVSGISAGMQAASQGGQGKGGVYNTQGTMAVMAEGNQRQDTNIKDFRLCLGGVIKAMFALQREMDPQDPTIGQLPQKMQPLVMRAMEMSTPDQLARSVFEVRVSDAAMNAEARKANLMTMANTLSQFSQQQQQLAGIAINEQMNPVLRKIAMETITMQHGIASALLNEFDLHGMIDDIPDARRAIEANQPQPGPGAGPAPQQPSGPGGMGPAGVPAPQ